METKIVTVKIADNIMRLLEDKKYLGDNDLQTFITKAIEHHVESALNEMPLEECREIERKYGLEVEELQ